MKTFPTKSPFHLHPIIEPLNQAEELYILSRWPAATVNPVSNAMTSTSCPDYKSCTLKKKPLPDTLYRPLEHVETSEAAQYCACSLPFSATEFMK